MFARTAGPAVHYRRLTNLGFHFHLTRPTNRTYIMKQNPAAAMAEDFAAKARINAKFVLAAIPAISRIGGITGIMAFQPAYQLCIEALELLLKALLAQQGMTPPSIHPLSSLYGELLPCKRAVVDQAVRDAIEESATGALPYGLPNIAAAGLLKPISLGVDAAEKDRTRGFRDMDAHAFFEMLDAEWEATVSQYVGYTRGFVVKKQTMRVDTRVLAGAIHACLALAKHIVGPEEDPTEYGCVLARRDASERFVAGTNPISWTDRIEEAELFDSFEKGIEAAGGDVTDWIGFRRRRDVPS